MVAKVEINNYFFDEYFSDSFFVGLSYLQQMASLVTIGRKFQSLSMKTPHKVFQWALKLSHYMTVLVKGSIGCTG